jgi:hypothetical protein
MNLTNYKGSTYNVLVSWETGESTYERLDFIASDDPITCDEYALKHNLLDAPGWKRFCHYTKTKNTLGRIFDQIKKWQACERCYSLFGGESAFDYTPESEICFSFDYTPESEI